MKNLNQYIQEKLIINKNYRGGDLSPKSFDELRKIIEQRYEEKGPGTKENPIDFNDIDVSNLDSFCNNKYQGIFNHTDFKYIDISYWDVSNIKSMNSMFAYCEELKSVGDISKWNVSNVEDMTFMFSYCNKLKSLGDISGWDVSKVTNMRSMFYSCTYFNQDISGWDVSNVTDMSYMFAWCESFNQDLSSWDISKVRSKTDIFNYCSIKREYMPKFK